MKPDTFPAQEIADNCQVLMTNGSSFFFLTQILSFFFLTYQTAKKYITAITNQITFIDKE
jgi:hypothetical protein